MLESGFVQQAAQRGHQLTFIAEDLPRFQADQPKLLKALSLLLDNAIRFSQEGATIEVSLRGQGGFIHMEVRDNGPGLTPSEVGAAEKLFRQLDGTSTRSTEGLGIGIPLARELVILHGGELFLKSEPGKGTLAGFSLPVDVRSQAFSNSKPTKKYATRKNMPGMNGTNLSGFGRFLSVGG